MVSGLRLSALVELAYISCLASCGLDWHAFHLEAKTESCCCCEGWWTQRTQWQGCQRRVENRGVCLSFPFFRFVYRLSIVLLYLQKIEFGEWEDVIRNYSQEKPSDQAVISFLFSETQAYLHNKTSRSPLSLPLSNQISKEITSKHHPHQPTQAQTHSTPPPSHHHPTKHPSTHFSSESVSLDLDLHEPESSQNHRSLQSHHRLRRGNMRLLHLSRQRRDREEGFVRGRRRGVYRQSRMRNRRWIGDRGCRLRCLG